MKFKAVGYCSRILITSSGFLTAFFVFWGYYETPTLSIQELLQEIFSCFLVLCMAELPMMILFGVLVEFLDFKDFSQLFFKLLLSGLLTVILLLFLSFDSGYFEFFMLYIMLYYGSTLACIWLYNLDAAELTELDYKQRKPL
jgi:hypothetical protein